MQAAADESMNPLLSDVCISSASAPTYFPAHYFQTQDHNGNDKEFNLIDGGIAANNPVRILIKFNHIINLHIYQNQLRTHIVYDILYKHFLMIICHFIHTDKLLPYIYMPVIRHF